MKKSLMIKIRDAKEQKLRRKSKIILKREWLFGYHLIEPLPMTLGIKIITSLISSLK